MSFRLYRIGLIVALAVVFASFTVVPEAFAEDGQHRAVQGVMDLRDIDIEESGIVSLDGEWAFFWDTIVDQSTFLSLAARIPDRYIEVPSYWDYLAETDPEITADGHATYRLDILLPVSSEQLALQFTNVTPNAEIRINGVLAAEMGHVDTDREFSRSGNQVQVIPLPRVGGRCILTVGVSNYHNVNGGLNRSISLGLFRDIRRNREAQLTVESLFMGGFLLMAIYQMALFVLVRTKRAPLFMAVICILAFFFAGMKHNMPLLALFPGWDGEIRTKIIFLALAITPAAFTCYAASMYPAHFFPWVNRVLAIASGLVSLVILATPKAVFTRTVIPLEIIMALAGIYNIVMLIRGYIRSRDRQILLYLGGLFFLLLGVGHSIVDNAFSLATPAVAGTLFIFILYQAFNQAFFYSYAFREIDVLHQQKTNLEMRNIELFSLSYIDSLTGTCNRRLMDDFLTSNWRVNALSGRPLGMILIDLDDFKAYNEFYGHRRGDLCLMKISEIIRETLSGEGQDTLARYGGEEFAVIISDIDEMSLFRLAENIRKAVESAAIENRPSVSSEVMTISLGCAILVPSMDSAPEDLLDAADRALGRAKNRGRNRTELEGAAVGDGSWEPRLV